MTVAYKAENDTHRLQVHYDEYPENPRREWDHVTTMKLLAPNRHGYNFMDGDIDVDEANTILNSDEYFGAPVYMIDHSGVSISLGSFAWCDPGEWDSGVVGIIYVARNHTEINNDADRAQEVFGWEVKELNQYLTGSVMGYVLESKQECDHGDTHYDSIDSCWGFYVDGLNEIQQELKSNLSEEFYPLIDDLD